MNNECNPTIFPKRCSVRLDSGKVWCSSILGLANLNGIKIQPFLQIEDIEVVFFFMSYLSEFTLAEFSLPFCFLLPFQLFSLMQVFTEGTFQYLFCSISGLLSYSTVPNSKPFFLRVHEVIWWLSTRHILCVHPSPEKGVCSAAHDAAAHTAHPCCGCGWLWQLLGRAQGMGVPSPPTGRKQPSVSTSTLHFPWILDKTYQLTATFS